MTPIDFALGIVLATVALVALAAVGCLLFEVWLRVMYRLFWSPNARFK